MAPHPGPPVGQLVANRMAGPGRTAGRSRLARLAPMFREEISMTRKILLVLGLLAIPAVAHAATTDACDSPCCPCPCCDD